MTRDEQRHLWHERGYHTTLGVISALWPALTAVVLISLAVSIAPDDCDSSFWHRCGMNVLTDHKTGVQYLESKHGLVKREDRP